MSRLLYHLSYTAMGPIAVFSPADIVDLANILASGENFYGVPCPAPDIGNDLAGEPPSGIEPTTSFLPRKCSTTELRGHVCIFNYPARRRFLTKTALSDH